MHAMQCFISFRNICYKRKEENGQLSSKGTYMAKNKKYSAIFSYKINCCCLIQTNEI